jgi:hypothetical protein
MRPYIENIDVVWKQEFRIKRLELDKKVLFLPYEEIDKIDEFFSGSNSGLSVDLIVAKAESVI